MKKIAQSCVLVLFVTIALSFKPFSENENSSTYMVRHLKKPININGDWDKPQWKEIETIKINNFVGILTSFQPTAEAKVSYYGSYLFVIFRVKDRYVQCVNKNINGPVWEDSCVEFFFSPDKNFPLRYFNIEVNCGGTALMHYNIVPRKEFKIIEKKEVKKIKIAHSLPKITNPELSDSITWTIEYRMPFSLIEKHSNATNPQKGDIWKANFYKVADKTSNRHYISWSPLGNGVVDFHQPQFFGDLKFE